MKQKILLTFTKVLFVILLVLPVSSCRKDNTDKKNTIEGSYLFNKSEFVGDIECYDSSGTKIETPPVFVKNDFLFSDGGEYPYKTIDINKDSSVYYTYLKQELEISLNGLYAFYKDTLYFFTNNYPYAPVFKGFIKNDILYIPAYGYKKEISYDDEYSFITYLGGTNFGFPNDNDMNCGCLGTVKRTYIQKFNLTYLKTN